MLLYNFHSHSKFSDGFSLPEDYLKKAIELGFKAYGFSEHAPVYRKNKWCMKHGDMKRYLSTVRSLQKKYKGKIDIYYGLEIDYIPGKSSVKKFKRYKLDYTIGSLHFIGSGEADDFFEIDAPLDIFESGFKFHFSGDPKKIVKTYYDLTIKMLQEASPDILGHFDKIKMHLLKEFPDIESKKWYKDQVNKVIEEIEKQKVIVEINTRGIYKGYCVEPYPSYWIIKKLNKRNIPMMINSDNHKPTEINKGFEPVISKIKEDGVQQLWIFSKNRFEPVKI